MYRSCLLLALAGLFLSALLGTDGRYLGNSKNNDPVRISVRSSSDDAGESLDSAESASDEDSDSSADSTSNANQGANCVNCVQNEGGGGQTGGGTADACGPVQSCESVPVFTSTLAVTVFNNVVVAGLIDNQPQTGSIADTFSQTLNELQSSGVSECSACTNNGRSFFCTYNFLTGPTREMTLQLDVEDVNAQQLAVNRIIFQTVEIPVYGRFRVTYTNPMLRADRKAFLSEPDSIEVRLPGSNIFIPFSQTMGPLRTECTVTRQCGSSFDPNAVITTPPQLFPEGVSPPSDDDLRSSQALISGTTLSGLACPNL
ncbi:uncharacterized protein LOC135831108 [Sycon ciliatum]|uniref:uncharacterized protein LOC135831108 n=1 Tax=Sycon ciliatum TaxID=27933 RepID=UPI0031F6B9CD